MFNPVHAAHVPALLFVLCDCAQCTQRCEPRFLRSKTGRQLCINLPVEVVLQFRGEFFNALNHVNLGAPGLNIRDPDNFGRVTSTQQGAGMPGDSRVVQFALKYSF